MLNDFGTKERNVKVKCVQKALKVKKKKVEKALIENSQTNNVSSS